MGNKSAKNKQEIERLQSEIQKTRQAIDSVQKFREAKARARSPLTRESSRKVAGSSSSRSSQTQNTGSSSQLAAQSHSTGPSTQAHNIESSLLLSPQVHSIDALKSAILEESKEELTITEANTDADVTHPSVINPSDTGLSPESSLRADEESLSPTPNIEQPRISPFSPHLIDVDLGTVVVPKLELANKATIPPTVGRDGEYSPMVMEELCVQTQKNDCLAGCEKTFEEFTTIPSRIMNFVVRAI